MEVVNCVLRGKGKPKKNKKTERSGHTRAKRISRSQNGFVKWAS